MALKFLKAILHHIVGHSEKSTSRVSNQPPSPPPTLATLPPDILYLVFELLYSPSDTANRSRYNHEKFKGRLLLPLSQTCWHLRVHTLPWIFRDVYNWDCTDESTWPETLWPFFQTVHIRDRSIRRPRNISLPPAMYHALSSMSSVTVVTLRMHDPVPVRLFQALSLVPQLRCLEVHQARFDGPADYSPLRFPNLKALLITVKGFEGVLRSDGIDRRSELSNVMALLNNLGSTLATLQISGDLLPLEFRSIKWLQLAAFTVTEHTPTPYVAVSGLVSNMPALTRLSVLYTADLKHTGDLFPPFTLGTSGGGLLSFTCPLLASVALSNMQPTDPIFTQLPPTLRSLHLLALTDGDAPGQAVLPRRYLEAPLTHATAQVTLGCLSYLTELTEFSLTLDDFVEAPLIQHVASHFPQLRNLEIRHATYEFDARWNSDVRDPNILAALQHFPSLAHLRISLNFFDRDIDPEREQRRAARWLFQGLPTLLTVSFLWVRPWRLFGLESVAWNAWNRAALMARAPSPSPPSSPSSSADTGSDLEQPTVVIPHW
ncbi:hypothetical protein FB45DRAFT_1010500 [Roridomyces roridus]|uniref:Uncharacterized protein n=1 Tax=Roridomyces roridus TaxID=1738132 RepID=A0AAD7B478_9AGAR|nr:hypothetical protein FB45DRAFT_1010500 [Roridomyces roridus]